MTEAVAAVAAAEATTETQVSADVVEQSQVETQVEQAQPDYSYVPPKFLVDGKPDWENFAKSYTNMEKRLGTKGAFAPEDITEYEFVPTVNIPIDEEATVQFKEAAKQAGLSKEQFAFVMDKYQEVMVNTGLDPEYSGKVLQKEWGSDFETNLGYASRAFNELAPSGVSKDDPVLNNPTVLKILAAVGREMGEDSQFSGRSSAVNLNTEEEIQALMKSPDYYKNPQAQERVRMYYEKRYK